MKFLREETSVSRNARTQSPPNISAGSKSKEEPQSLPTVTIRRSAVEGLGGRAVGDAASQSGTQTHTQTCVACSL